MLYQVKVTETRLYDVIYTVEADTAAEAEEKAAIGSTVDEQEDIHASYRGDVWDRHVHEVDAAPQEAGR